MARGQVAKEVIAEKIIAALGDCYIGTADKKYYFEAEENGEMVQVCVSMTCPKTPLVIGADLASGSNTTIEAAVSVHTDMSEEDKAKVKELMEKLGIS